MPPQGPPGFGPPPQGPPQGAPPGYGPPPERAPQEQPEHAPRNRAVPWMIATGVSAAVALAAIGWGYVQKTDADSAAQQTQAEVASLQAQVAKAEKEDQDLQAELDQAKADYAKVEEKYKTKKNDLQGETAKLEDLEKQYNQAKKDAESKQATLRDQLQAAEAKSELATKCAQVMATGMTLIYDADTPAKVMNEVVKQMDKASASCDGVVNVGG
jgi:septal ring factor EnvC (AmiA/AmiB activator)